MARDPLPALPGRPGGPRRRPGGRWTRSTATPAAAVDRATEEAKAGRRPACELAVTNVWADGGNAWAELIHT